MLLVCLGVILTGFAMGDGLSRPCTKSFQSFAARMCFCGLWPGTSCSHLTPGARSVYVVLSIICRVKYRVSIELGALTIAATLQFGANPLFT